MVKKTAKKIRSGIASLEFPRISRFIPEDRAVGRFYMILFSLILVGLILTGIEFFHDAKERSRLFLERTKLEAELSFWRETVEKYSGFRDGYFKMAVLNYRLGDKVTAKQNLAKTLEIDPNFQKGREFEAMINSK